MMELLVVYFHGQLRFLLRFGKEFCSDENALSSGRVFVDRRFGCQRWQRQGARSG
jgi:hypothetical protein